jgi:hypothetical protein
MTIGRYVLKIDRVIGEKFPGRRHSGMEAFVDLVENAVGSSPFASEPTLFPQLQASILPIGVHSSRR